MDFTYLIPDIFLQYKCPVCQDKENACVGGGNLKCIKRDPVPSKIAGILDSFGGVRVVVAHEDTFVHHIGSGEFLAVVKDKIAHEPINYVDWEPIVALGTMAIDEWVEKNKNTNDLQKQVAIRAYNSRKTWHAQRSLDSEAIAFT